jgi:putative tryptophan/tyrosine transport system substrate-binding protein
VEGRNLLIDYRSADGKFERLPAWAAELIQFKPDLIVAIGDVSALAAQKMMRDVPIVFAYVSDVVGSGLVEGLARPAANVTGLTHHNSSLNPKRHERREPSVALTSTLLWAGAGRTLVSKSGIAA